MLVNIQLLRFVAATMVVVYHTAAHMPSTAGWASPLFAIGNATGFAGVDIFFVISGFIMAHTTLGAEGATPASDFMRRRLARIYSGYWPFYVLALAVFAWARPGHLAEAALWNSFWLWPQSLNRNLLELSWTLSFELYFYVLFTLLVCWCPPRWRLRACAGVMLALVVFNLIRHFVFDGFGHEGLLLLGFWDRFLTSPYVVEFFAGAVLAYLLHERPGGLAWTWLVVGCGLFLAGGAISETLFEGRIEQGYHVVARVGLFGASGVLIVAGLVRLEARGKIAPRRFSLSLGGASYAIYLSHGPLLALARKAGFSSLHEVLPASLAYLMLVGVILALSVLHFRVVERPLHHAFRRALRVRAGTP